MALEFQEDFEFPVSDAELEFDPAPEVHRVVLETSAAPKGRITAKLRKEVEEEKEVDGMEGTETKEVMYEATELPDNVKNIVKKAQNQEEDLTCVATVAKNENGHMMILDEHIETLEARLLQDDRDE